MRTSLTLLVARVLLWWAPQEFRVRFRDELAADLPLALRGGASGWSVVRDVWRTVRRERQLRRTGWWMDLGGDLRYVLRGWRRGPGFTLTILSTLALSVGLSAAIFSFVDGYLFRPLPFPGADRVYLVRDPDAQIASALMATEVQALRATDVGPFGWVEWSLASPLEMEVGGQRVEARAYEVTEGFRKTLQLPLVVGRDFTPADHHPGPSTVAWASWRFWTRELGQNEDLIGRPLSASVRGRPQTVEIVGVLAPTVASFDATNPPPDLVVPAAPKMPIHPRLMSFPMVAIPSGMSVEQAEASIGAALQAVAPAAVGKARRVRLRSLLSMQVWGGAPTARVFLVGAALVVVLAALNLFHLLLCRGVARQQEMAIRRALGAGRWRVARLGVLEGLTLGAVGCAFGLGLGYVLFSVIENAVPEFPTVGRNLSMVPMVFDARVVAVAGTLGMLVAVASAIWPSLAAVRRPPTVGTTRTTMTVSGRLTRALLASELSVAVVVLVGACFIGIGIYRYLNQPLGFDYRGRAEAFLERTDGQPLESAIVDAWLARLHGGTVVRAASPYRAGGARVPVQVGLRTVAANDVSVQYVPPQYFEAWGHTIEAGRALLPEEHADEAPVVLVNRVAAEQWWPGDTGVGQVITVGERQYDVVGVITPRRDTLERDPGPAIMLPARATTGRGSFVVWAPGREITTLVSELSAIAAQIDPALRVTGRALTFDSLFMRGIGEARFQTPIMATFGVLAAVLAAVGVFGLVSYTVERRMREFGIRIAIGADRLDIWRRVASEAIVPAIAGVGTGSLAAWWLERYVESAVFGWQSSGSAAVTAVAIVLLVVTTLAILRPASRAARVDPAEILKAE
jgi:predicted permease